MILMTTTGISGRGTRSEHIDKTLGQKSPVIAIVGLGSVGMRAVIRAASHAYAVTGFDSDDVKVAQLSARETGFLDQRERAALQHARGLRFTSDPLALREADVFIICVSVPIRDTHIDTRSLERAAELVGHSMRRDSLIVIETNAVPGLSESVVLPALLRASKMERGEFYLAYATTRIGRPAVVGGIQKDSGEQAARLYREHTGAPILLDSLREAEAVNFAENAYDDVLAALADEFAIGFDRSGIDVIKVIDAATPRGGTPIYPRTFRKERVPTDPYTFIRRGRPNASGDRLLTAASRTLSGMPFFVVRILADALREKKRALKRCEVVLLGSSAQESTEVDDVIIVALKKRGASVRVFDPNAPMRSNVRSLDDALEGAGAVMIVSKHPAFCDITPSRFESAGIEIVVDAANCLDKDAFRNSDVIYRGLGR